MASDEHSSALRKGIITMIGARYIWIKILESNIELAEQKIIYFDYVMHFFFNASCVTRMRTEIVSGILGCHVSSLQVSCNCKLENLH